MSNFKKYLDEINEFGDFKTIDEIGNFWVVTKSIESSTLRDALFESNIKHLFLQIKGGLEFDEILYIGKDKEKAMTMAKRSIVMAKRGQSLSSLDKRIRNF